jgi:hypothetical protein
VSVPDSPPLHPPSPSPPYRRILRCTARPLGEWEKQASPMTNGTPSRRASTGADARPPYAGRSRTPVTPHISRRFPTRSNIGSTVAASTVKQGISVSIDLCGDTISWSVDGSRDMVSAPLCAFPGEYCTSKSNSNIRSLHRASRPWASARLRTHRREL